MKRLKRRLFEVEFHDPGTWHFKDVNILDVWPHIAGEPMVVRKAYAQRYIGEHLPATVKSDELIVGNPNQNSVGWGTVLPLYFTQEEGEQAARCQLNEASVWGHHPPAWEKIVNLGVAGVKREVEAARDGEIAADAPDETALAEYRAMLVALDAITVFALRHQTAAIDAAARCHETARHRELLEIAARCEHVATKPARSFAEAIQAYWFTYCQVNSGGEYVPLGRADQILYPYYRSDLDAGVLTEAEARDLLASLLIKCNERVLVDTRRAENHYDFGLFSQGVPPATGGDDASTNQTGGYNIRALTWQEGDDLDSDANFNYGQSGNDWLMNCIVAGQHPDGSDATTELSHLFVELMHDLELLMPTLAVRIHAGTPVAFLEHVAGVLRYGQGEPTIYNDDAIIPGLVDLGVPLEEARDYSNDGCWETLVPGRSHFSYAHVMNLRCLEWVLFRGVSQHSQQQEGLDTGDPADFRDFDDFYAAYRQQVEHSIDLQCKRRLANFGLSFMIAPDPLMSALMDDCIAKGRDISQDGARYIFHQLLVTGFASTVDSLMVVKRLVYEEQSVSMETLTRALAADWAGYEQLRAAVRNTVPKYGNDCDEVDALGVRVLADFAAHVAGWNARDTAILFPCGVGTFENYAALGRDLGASADGRRAGEALAPNYSPTPGLDLEGPTASIRSATRADLLKFYAGTPLDLSINANEVEGEAGVARIAGLIRGFCELGGQILTVTSTSVDDLRDAKVNPDRHQGLRVRMGGLSAYFVAMSPVQQDNIIRRFAR